MLPYSDSRWTKIALIAFFVVILGYAYYEARGLLFGPSIAVASEVATVHEAYVLIEGKADRIVSLSMNGREITVTEQGAFKEPYLLAPGDNRIVFDAKDKYGHVSSRTVEMLYVPDTQALAEPAGTSTSATSTATSSPAKTRTSTTTP